MNIQEFRAKHPELNDVSDEQLTDYVRERHVPHANREEFHTYFRGEETGVLATIGKSIVNGLGNIDMGLTGVGETTLDNLKQNKEYRDDPTFAETAKPLHEKVENEQSWYQDLLNSKPESITPEEFDKAEYYRKNLKPKSALEFGLSTAANTLGIPTMGAFEPSKTTGSIVRDGIADVIGVENLDTAQKAVQGYRKQTQDFVQKNNPFTHSNTSPKAYVRDTIQSVLPSVAIGIGTYYATKNPSLALGTMFPYMQGASYVEGKDKGLSLTENNQRSLVSAGIENLSEKIPLGIAIKKGGSMIMNMIKASGTEALQEGFVEATNMLYDAQVINDETPLEEVPSRIIHSMILGGLGGTMMRLPAEVVEMADSYMTKRAEAVLDKFEDSLEGGERDEYFKQKQQKEDLLNRLELLKKEANEHDKIDKEQNALKQKEILQTYLALEQEEVNFSDELINDFITQNSAPENTVIADYTEDNMVADFLDANRIEFNEKVNHLNNEFAKVQRQGLEQPYSESPVQETVQETVQNPVQEIVPNNVPNNVPNPAKIKQQQNQAKLKEKAKAKAKQVKPVEQPPIQQGKVGDKLGTGEVRTTNTGRNTSPFPKVDTSTPRKATNTVKRADNWLIDNAIEEAQSRDDDFNVQQFKAVDRTNITTADKDSAEAYLFNPDGVTTSPKKILKPLVEQPVVNKEKAEPIKHKDTRNKGVQYHGTSNKIPETDGKPTLEEYTYGTNHYGQGFYSTDAFDIAQGYTKKGKGKEPSTYQVTKKRDLKLYDIERPLSDKDRAMLAKVDRHYKYLNEEEYKNLTMREFMDDMKDDVTHVDDILDEYEAISERLQKRGYDGFRHDGGTLTGKQKHNVEIYWNPKDDIEIQKVDAPTDTEQKPETKAEKQKANREKLKPKAKQKPKAKNTVAVNDAVTLNKQQQAELEQGGNGLAGELNPDVINSLVSMRTNPNVPVMKPKGKGFTYADPKDGEFIDIGRGYSIRATNMNGNIKQEIKLPNGTVIERGLTKDGQVYGSIEGTLEQLMTNEGQSEIAKLISDFYNKPKAKASTKELDKPKAEPKPKTNKIEKTNIEDFGERIEGAKKHQSFAEEFTEEQLLDLPFSKIWAKDKFKDIDDPTIQATLHIIRSSIKTKPRVAYKKKAWLRQTKSIMESIDKLIIAPFNEGNFNSKEVIGSIFTDERANTLDYIKILVALEQNQWDRVELYTVIDNSNSEKKWWFNIDGRRVFVEGNSVEKVVIPKIQELVSKEKVKSTEVKFEIRVYRKSGKAFITKKGLKGRPSLIEFDNVEKARQFMDDKHDELVGIWDKYKERNNVTKADMRNTDNRERKGKDRRDAKPVTEEMFTEAFGFRGVQFGNWVKNNTATNNRQDMLNRAYDALFDLAEILDIPTQAISLNGELALAFGARGKGKASAHYEPNQVVINLTKTKGAGSLAHEWFHALDHYFQRQRGKTNGLRSGTYITYKPELMMVHKTTASTPSTKADLERRFKSTNANYYNPENWMPDPNHKTGVRPEVEAKFASLVNLLHESEMKKRSFKVDKGKEDGYWSRIIEMGARSFEKYVIVKMDDANIQNDYLANIASIDQFKRNPDLYPYLLDSEVEPVANAFDDLFSTMEVEQTEKGVKLFDGIQARDIEVLDSVSNKPIKESVWKQTVPDKAVKYLREGKLKQALKIMMDQGDPSIKPLALKIYSLIPQRVSVVVNDLNSPNAHGTATINENNVEVELFTAGERTGLSYATVLHESLHAIIGAKFHTFRYGGVEGNYSKIGTKPPKNIKAINDYLATWKEFQSWFDHLPEHHRKSLANNFAFRDAYSNPDEFFTRSLTDPEFQQILSDVTYHGKNFKPKNKTIMQRFWDWVKGLFGYMGETKPKWFDVMVKANETFLASLSEQRSDYRVSKKISNKQVLREGIVEKSTPNKDKRSLVSTAIERAVINPMGKMFNSRVGLNTRMTNQLVKWFSGMFTNNAGVSLMDQFYEQMEKMDAERNQLASYAEKKVETPWDKLSTKESTALSKVMNDATYERLDPTLSFNEQPRTIQHREKIKEKEKQLIKVQLDLKDDPTNAKLKRSHTRRINTIAKYKKQLKDMEATHRSIVNAYKLLSKKAQDQFVNVRDFYLEMWEKQRVALVDRVAFMSIADKEKADEIKEALIKDINDTFEQGTNNGIYFPLARFGEYVVVAKKGNKVMMRVHYESESEQLHNQKQMAKDNPDWTVKVERTSEQRDEMMNISKYANQLVEQIRTQDSQGKDGESRQITEKFVIDIINQTMLRALPHNSSGKRMLHRRYVQGASLDQRRAFAETSFHSSVKIARIKYEHKINRELKHMRDLLKSDSYPQKNINQAQAVYDHLVKVHNSNLNPNAHRFSSYAVSGAFLMHLALSPATGGLNATQTWLLGVPILGRDFGINDSLKEINKISGMFMKQAMSEVNNAKFNKIAQAEAWVSLADSNSLNKEMNKGLSKDAQLDWNEIVTELHETGVVEKTQMAMLAQLMDTDMTENSLMQRGWIKFMRGAGSIFHNAEMFNREVIAVASIKLWLKQNPQEASRLSPEELKTKMMGVARKYVKEIHFDYSSDNRALMMRGTFPKMFFVFRTYTQNLMDLLVYNFNQSIKGATLEDRKAHAKALIAVMVGHTIAGGVLVLPAFMATLQLIAFIYNAFVADDDDEPLDLVSEMRTAVHKVNPVLEDLLFRGAFNTLTGWDLSTRLKMEFLWRSPSRDLNGKEYTMHMIEEGLGAVYGTLIKVTGGIFTAIDGYKKEDNHKMMKGTVKALPRFLADPTKAVYRMVNGELSNNGDQIMPREEFVDWGLLRTTGQLLGFSPAKLTDTYDLNIAKDNHDSKLSKRKSNLVQRYVLKVLNNVSTDGILNEIDAFSEKFPEHAITYNYLLGAIKKAEKRKERVVNGRYENPNKQETSKKYNF